MIRVEALELPDGECPFREWLQSLSATNAVRVREGLTRMQLGNFGDAKSVGDGVQERRFHFGPGYRVYFGRDGDALVLLLTGGTKQRQDRDIRTAKRLWREYLQAKAERG